MCPDYGKYALAIYYLSNNIIGERTVVLGELELNEYSVEWLIVIQILIIYLYICECVFIDFLFNNVNC